MKHTSVKLNTPAEFINITGINPLVSKCQIKVCYVGEQPNRNGSVITKDVAIQMANSLPGSPIVGFYNEHKEDFEGHERELVVEDNIWYFKDTTRPYGFVDVNAPTWFQKFTDDGVDHEYLMTEGYLWTGQYPEARRIIEKGNNQSMELDDTLTTGYWSENTNANFDFFIINEAVISKLCILGEDIEPCFEGANITNLKFSFGDDFTHQMSEMMNQMKEIIKGDGTMTTDDIVITPDPVEGQEPNVPGDAGADLPAEGDTSLTYNLEEIPEYVELSQKYSDLETEYNTLKASFESLEAENNTLNEFKLQAERKDKEEMIARFNMLTDEQKSEVVEHIDSYSVQEIEEKLSVIAFRSQQFAKVEPDNQDDKPGVTSYNLNPDNQSGPSWLNAVRAVANAMK